MQAQNFSQEWDDLVAFLKNKNKYIIPIPTNGFCFISALIKSLHKDHNINITEKQAIQLILKQLINDYLHYVNFHAVCKCHEEQSSNLSASDALITEASDFIENRSYTDPVVDLLMQVTCDALHVNLYILQNHNGYIQLLCNSGGQCCKDIYLKFTHNNLHSQGNQYDSIVNGQLPDTNNLELLSEVAVNEVAKSKEMTQVHLTDIPICDGDEKVIILYEDEDYFDIIPPPKKKPTSLPQIQSTSQ